MIILTIPEIITMGLKDINNDNLVIYSAAGLRTSILGQGNINMSLDCVGRFFPFFSAIERLSNAIVFPTNAATILVVLNTVLPRPFRVVMMPLWQVVQNPWKPSPSDGLAGWKDSVEQEKCEQVTRKSLHFAHVFGSIDLRSVHEYAHA